MQFADCNGFIQLSRNDPVWDAGHSSPFWDRSGHSGTGSHPISHSFQQKLT